jgi:hypothetical protein
VYSCPWILGLTARLVLASEQAEPASEPGNRSLSSIWMHCQYRKTCRKFMQLPAVTTVASGGLRSARRALRTGAALSTDETTWLGFLEPQPGQTYLR